MVKQHPSVIAIGKHKGHPITKLVVPGKQKKPVKQARTKGRLGKRVGFIRQVISQISGVAPYEKRVMELLKTGSSKDTKKALKISKKALGTHRRAKLKRQHLVDLIRQQSQAQQDKAQAQAAQHKKK